MILNTIGMLEAFTNRVRLVCKYKSYESIYLLYGFGLRYSMIYYRVLKFLVTKHIIILFRPFDKMLLTTIPTTPSFCLLELSPYHLSVFYRISYFDTLLRLTVSHDGVLRIRCEFSRLFHDVI